MLAGGARRDPSPSGTPAGQESQLELEVELALGAEARPFRRRLGGALAGRAPDLSPGDDDAARAAVVGDGKVAPVRQQGIAVGSHDPPEIGGVLER